LKSSSPSPPTEARYGLRALFDRLALRVPVPLAFYLSGVGSVVVAAIFLSYGAYTSHEQEAFAADQIRSITRAMAANVGASVADDIISQRMDNIEALLLRLVQIGDVREIVVADSRGAVLSRVLRPAGTDGAPDYSQAGRPLLPTEQSVTETGLEFRYSTPIIRGDRIGVVLVSSGLERLKVVRQHIYLDTMRAIWVALAATILALGLALKGTIRTLTRIAHFAHVITLDQGAKLGVETKVAEIRELVDALNTMSATLASQYNALAESRRRELETGSQIHRALLLGEVPKGMYGVLIATRSEPSQGIDGDFFSIHRHSETCFDMLVGDVMGKGISAALIGAGVKNSYGRILAELLARSLGEQRLPDIAVIINALHIELTPRLISLDAFVTLAAYRFDLEARTLSYVTAGHTAGLLYRSRNGAVESVLGENLPIGVSLTEVYVQGSVPVGPGDALLAYSDGIIEARNKAGEEYGQARLAEIVRAGRAAQLPPTALLQAIKQEVLRFTGNAPPIDDQSSALVLVRPLRGPARTSIDKRAWPVMFDVAWQLDSIAEIRRQLLYIADVLPESARDQLILAAVEAAANIIRHAELPFADPLLSCSVSRSATALVLDLFYPGKPFVPAAYRVPDFSADAEGGFGLFIIGHYVDEVSYQTPLPGIASVRLIKKMTVAND
jgi:serine phosphatase RsbU (regulator of sigma subunit)/anti-sigma regulatory factor (Ser/Thr protein kinase)